MDAGFSAPFPHLNRWFNTIVNQDAVKAVIGEAARCKKMGTFDIKLWVLSLIRTLDINGPVFSFQKYFSYLMKHVLP